MFAIDFSDGCPMHVYSSTSRDNLLAAVRDRYRLRFTNSSSSAPATESCEPFDPAVEVASRNAVFSISRTTPAAAAETLILPLPVVKSEAGPVGGCRGTDEIVLGTGALPMASKFLVLENLFLPLKVLQLPTFPHCCSRGFRNQGLDDGRIRSASAHSCGTMAHERETRPDSQQLPALEDQPFYTWKRTNQQYNTETLEREQQIS